jgi:hypothetical protein
MHRTRGELPTTNTHNHAAGHGHWKMNGIRATHQALTNHLQPHTNIQSANRKKKPPLVHVLVVVHKSHDLLKNS